MSIQISQPLKIVFMGTPNFAAAILTMLNSWDKGIIVATYCQPDQPVGRGHRVQFPPVKEVSLKLGIPIEQPVSLKGEEQQKILQKYSPDFLIVVAYGRILPQEVLAIPTIAPLNVHASLLPLYRGAAPIQRAIMAGEIVTGVTIMHMDQGLDTGAIYGQKALAIGTTDTSEIIHDQLAILGGQLLLNTLEQAVTEGLPVPISQDDTYATYAEKLFKPDGYIQWSEPAQVVHNLIRGVTPHPGARTEICFNKRATVPSIIAHGRIGDITCFDDISMSPGKILGFVDNAIAVACLDRPYFIERLCPAGGKFMTAKEFWNGYIQEDTSAFFCSLKR